ncbi:hypothetical protein BC830DRAFT_1130474 [Chytriomyces sp. MP71]|nr:hypothetical protein BC830DRAFT_1138285 [Chytriomyces sp. MP71]KAI8613802.1 hypothetical protein BC830DRAFT_1130474 [Chytriomyces sp. MP71]
MLAFVFHLWVSRGIFFVSVCAEQRMLVCNRYFRLFSNKTNCWVVQPQFTHWYFLVRSLRFIIVIEASQRLLAGSCGMFETLPNSLLC